jgi:hypothetical protein
MGGMLQGWRIEFDLDAHATAAKHLALHISCLYCFLILYSVCEGLYAFGFTYVLLCRLTCFAELVFVVCNHGIRACKSLKPLIIFYETHADSGMAAQLAVPS